jgi:hypothetical protein
MNNNLLIKALAYYTCYAENIDMEEVLETLDELLSSDRPPVSVATVSKSEPIYDRFPHYTDCKEN